VEYVYSGWRLGKPPELGADERPHANLERQPGKSLFETIEQSGLEDAVTYVVARSESNFVILNVYPYTPGHLLVLPRRAIPSVLDLSDEEYDDLWRLVRVATVAVSDAFHPEGINIGINEGRAGGGSQPEHLHVHVVPRWSADTNFMTTVSEARILPITLAEAWERVRAAWPDGQGYGPPGPTGG
jgi:ATP adenylyltransferase